MFAALKNALRIRNAGLFTYHTHPADLTPDVEGRFGRLIVARDPGNGKAMAACWDCAETRRHARRWVDYGLRIELVDRDTLRAACAGNASKVFATTQPIGQMLSPSAAVAALGGPEG